MNNKNTSYFLNFFVIMVFVLIMPFLPILISGRLNWWEAWVYGILGVLVFVVSRILAVKRHPDLLTERFASLEHENTKSWDKLLAPMVSLGSVFIPLVAGFDRLLGWSLSFGLPVKILSLVIIFFGYFLSSYALWENSFFSGVVRIQIERGHRVVSGGPYRWIRHPGYAGALFSLMATPFLLDSLWAFLPVIFITIILIIRTYLEDGVLQEELEGYRDYAGKVRFRLVPGIW